MSDEPRLKLVKPPKRTFLERFSVPPRVIKRRRRIAKMCNDLHGVMYEFNEQEPEYEDFVARFTRQDISLMIEHLHYEMRRVEYDNLEAIRLLHKLRPVKVWSGE